MGVFKYRYFSSSSFDDCNQNSSNNIIRIESSPDPSDYTIINAKTINNFIEKEKLKDKIKKFLDE